MAELLLFHHAQGLTAGCLSFVDQLRAAGHVVHAPDLYDGKTFAELADGIGYGKQIGIDTVMERSAVALPALRSGDEFRLRRKSHRCGLIAVV